MIRLRVREIAQEKGMSQGRLSRKADVDVKTIRKILRNPTEIITTETLDKLATALEIHVCELIEQIPDMLQSTEFPEQNS